MNLLIVVGSANPSPATGIARALRLTLCERVRKQYPDGELHIGGKPGAGQDPDGD